MENPPFVWYDSYYITTWKDLELEGKVTRLHLD